MVIAVGQKAQSDPTDHAGPSSAPTMRPTAIERLERHTFVLGVFSDAAVAHDAERDISCLATPADRILLVSKANCPAALIARPPFDALWASLSDPSPAPLGENHLALDLSQRVAGGACLVIAEVKNHERQRAVSRALLDANCDLLLTRDIAWYPSDPHGRACRIPAIHS